MTKKKKIIWSSIIVAILAAGIAVGVHFVVKDNKAKEREEALKNIPFLGFSSELVDSLFAQADLEKISFIRLFQDELCGKDLNEGLNLVSYKDLNQLKKDIDSLDPAQNVILDINASLDSNLTLEQLALDIPFSVAYLSRISAQTGIQIFKVDSKGELPNYVDTTKLFSQLDSLKKELGTKGILLASKNAVLYKSVPINFVDFEVDSARFKDKQLQISENNINATPCIDPSLRSQIDTRFTKNSQRQIVAVKEWIKRHPIVKDTLVVDLKRLSNYFVAKTNEHSFGLTNGTHLAHEAEKVYATTNLRGLKEFSIVRQIKKSVKYIDFKQIKNSPKAMLIGLEENADSTQIAHINSTKNAIVIPLSPKAPIDQITVCKVLPMYDMNVSANLKKVFKVLAGGGQLTEASIFKDQTIPLTRNVLTYAKPEEAGLNPDSLRKINYLVQRAMGGKAFPGCEVLVIKDGNIVWEKYYGKATYKPSALIDENDVYDIASMTKVVSTTMVAMKLYEQGHFKLDDKIKDYIPDTIVKYLPYKKHTIADITFRELLIHKSGLPSGAPIIQYLDYIKRKKIENRFDAYYCDLPDDSLYNVEIAEGMYMDHEYQDSMWIKLNSMFLHPNKPYKYSDVNMNLLYRLFDRMINKNELVKRHPKDTLYNGFYQYYREQILEPLELKNTLYMPRRNKALENIVPTENDRFWRKQLVHGYVHDPSAALMGGIAGNAGVFSNIKDLAVLFQMLEQGGVYKESRVFNPETIKLFASRQENSHRGLGFNKPNLTGSTFGVCDEASKATYGHTGFTGTCFWTDPENGLIYVFLSNRVHPKVNKRIYQYGVRKGIHNIIYGSMLK